MASSNVTESGHAIGQMLWQAVNSSSLENITFPTPTITRHSYYCYLGVEEKRKCDVLYQIMYGIALPCICLLGIIGNTLNLPVLFHLLHTKPLYLHLTWLAIADLTVCILTLVFSGWKGWRVPLRLPTPYSWAVFSTNVLLPLLNAAIACSCLTTLTITLERLRAVACPLFQAGVKKRRRGKYTAVKVAHHHHRDHTSSMSTSSLRVTGSHAASQPTVQTELCDDVEISSKNETVCSRLACGMPCHVNTNIILPILLVFIPLLLFLPDSLKSVTAVTNRVTNVTNYRVRRLPIVADNMEIYKMLVWVRAVLFRMVCVAGVVVSNVAILLFYHRSVMFRQASMGSLPAATRKMGRELLTLLLIISCIFVVCIGPSAVKLILDTDKSNFMMWIYQIFTVITNFLEVLNSAINFYCYCLGSSSYRKHFLKVFKRMLHC